MSLRIRCITLSLLAALALWQGAAAQTPATSPIGPPRSDGPSARSDLWSSPLTLERVVARFLQRNLSVEAARYRVEIARAEQIAARLRPNPGLTLSAENFKVSGDTPFDELYEVSATYAQTFEPGARRRLRREVAELTVSLAEAQMADVLRQRLLEAKRAYYEAVLARYALANAVENRDNFDQLIRFNQARFEEGAIAEGELLKVRLERVKFGAAVAQAQLATRQASIKLLELLGESDLSQAVEIAGDLQFAPVAANLARLKEVALRNRPDIRAGERGTKLAERRISLEIARSSTDVTPFFGIKRVGKDNTVLFGVTIPLRLYDKNQAAEADYQAAQSSYDSAVEQLEALSDAPTGPPGGLGAQTNYRVRAPISGTVVKVHKAMGEQVAPGEPIVEIIDLDTVWVEAPIFEHDLHHLGQRVEAVFTTPVNPGREYRGTLIDISAVIDKQSRAATVTFEVPNPDRTLRIGMQANVRLDAGEQVQAVLILKEAVLENEGKRIVYVLLSGEEFQRREVTLGDEYGDRVAVLSGLRTGERVVTQGAYQLKLQELRPAAAGAHTHET